MIRSINPHRPSDVVLELEPAGDNAVGEAVERARNALPRWSRLSAAERGRALGRIARELEASADELTALQLRECGKPLSEARAEVVRAIAIFDYYAQLVLAPEGETYPSPNGATWLTARRFPVGVVGLIVPWNSPVAIHAWKCAPALGYGNTAVLKPAPQSAAVASRVHELTARHLPDGVLELVHGGAETGQALVAHPAVAALSFTGSVGVGQAVAAAAVRRGAGVQCETGGQNPSIVLADADVDHAATTIAYAAMAYAGQKCTATRRVIVEEPIYEEFRDRLVAAVEALVVVDPADAACVVGPLIEAASVDRALLAIEQSGGHVLTGGEVREEEGFYLAPTLVELPAAAGILAEEEVFAPVAALIKAPDSDAAIAVANDVRFGLSAALFTRDLRSVMTLVDRMEAGLIRVNAPTTGSQYYTPFGGIKASSIGPREQGLAARDFYTELRTILISDFDLHGRPRSDAVPADPRRTRDEPVPRAACRPRRPSSACRSAIGSRRTANSSHGCRTRGAVTARRAHRGVGGAPDRDLRRDHCGPLGRRRRRSDQPLARPRRARARLLRQRPRAGAQGAGRPPPGAARGAPGARRL